MSIGRFLAQDLPKKLTCWLLRDELNCAISRYERQRLLADIAKERMLYAARRLEIYEKTGVVVPPWEPGRPLPEVTK